MLSRLIPAALLLSGIAHAFAGEPELAPVVVTAIRLAQTADQTLAPITVITRQDIERSQAQSVQDLLRGQPGIAVANNGGAGKTTNLFLRGANSDHVLVLIDGIKVGSATAGTASFQDLPLELIERIEIVRGPRSSLYGSEALGGVIQIFTRKGGDQTRQAYSLGAGSYGTDYGSAALSGGFGGSGWYSLGLSTFETQGFNACKGSRSAGCFTIEPDRDGYRNQSARLRAGWRFGEGTEAEVNWLQGRGDSKYDGTLVNQSKAAQQVLGVSLDSQLSTLWRSILRLGQSQDNADNFKDGVYTTRFNTRRNTLSWQNDLRLTEHQQVVAGVDWQNDSVDSSTAYAVTSRDNTGLFAQYLAEFGSHSLQLSGRRDDNQQFGTKSTGGATWGYQLNDGLRWTAAYGTAFKAPTFNQLYFPGFGNANLHPESSRNVDLGLAAKGGGSSWSLNAFESRVTDLIGFDASFNPVNIDTARIRGIEAVAATRLSAWDLRGNLTLLDPRNLAAGTSNGKLLPRRAQQALALNADRDFGAWSVGGSLKAEDRRYDNSANTIRLGAYATVDVHGEYRLSRDLRLQARVDNLFDKHYESAYLYNQAGRGLYLTLRYQPTS